MTYEKAIWPPKWQVILLVVIAVLIYLLTARYSQGQINLLVLAAIIVVMYLLSGAILNSWNNSSEGFAESDSVGDQGVCTGSCSSNSDLLPIMEPEFNLRECAKQLILLEDHLNNKRKRCEDCIKKHCLTIEALAEEGAGLDKKGTCRGECNELAEKMRQVEQDILSGRDLSEIAQELRQIRKPLMIKYFDRYQKVEEDPDYG